MTDRLTHANLQENLNAVYAYRTQGFQGVRLYLEVVREEGALPVKRRTGRSHGGAARPWHRRIAGLLPMMVHVSVEAICASIRYIPLWAEEISRLPGPAKKGRERDKMDFQDKEKKDR